MKKIFNYLDYIEQRFTEHNLETYLLPRKVTLECYSPSFQYKVLNNIVFLKKKLLMLGNLIHHSVLCANCVMKQ